RIALKPAPIDLTAPILRTTRPKATPRSRSTAMPCSASAVVTGNPAGAGCVIPAIVGTPRSAPGDCGATREQAPPRVIRPPDGTSPTHIHIAAKPNPTAGSADTPYPPGRDGAP